MPMASKYSGITGRWLASGVVSFSGTALSVNGGGAGPGPCRLTAARCAACLIHTWKLVHPIEQLAVKRAGLLGLRVFLFRAARCAW